MIYTLAAYYFVTVTSCSGPHRFELCAVEHLQRVAMATDLSYDDCKEKRDAVAPFMLFVFLACETEA